MASGKSRRRAEVIHFGDESRGDQRDDVRAGFANPNEVGTVLGPFRRPAVGVSERPELALDQVVQGGNGQADAEEFALGGASGKRAVTLVDGNLDAQPAAGQLRVDGIRKLLHDESGGPQRAGQAGGRRDGEIGIQRHDRLDKVVHRQPTDEAERLARGTERIHCKAEVGVMPGQGGEEFLFAHNGSGARRSRPHKPAGRRAWRCRWRRWRAKSIVIAECGLRSADCGEVGREPLGRDIVIPAAQRSAGHLDDCRVRIGE